MSLCTRVISALTSCACSADSNWGPSSVCRTPSSQSLGITGTGRQTIAVRHPCSSSIANTASVVVADVGGTASGVSR
jgi:hypothetical protein